MPELPEVETVRRGLERWMVGRTVAGVELFGPRTVRRHAAGPADFIARVTGRRVEAACRRGKYLWLPLSPAPSALVAGPQPRSESPAPSALVAGPQPRSESPAPSALVAGPQPRSGDTAPSALVAGPQPRSGDTAPSALVAGPQPRSDDDEPDHAVVAHLGMSGQFLAVPPGTADSPHLRARFTFSDGAPEIRFLDQRTFGGLSLDVLPEGRDGMPAPIAHIAPDPLEQAFDPAVFRAALRRRRTGLKRALLDQSLVSGIGNIYADEALWQARLHYARGTDSLRRPEVDRLLGGVREVLQAAIAAGGTSFDALYVAVDGESGYFDRSLEVYGREGEPCARCGAAIRREHFMSRSSYRCPRCQRVPKDPRW
jgi:formamidopyrimidine-DNA glycosylase